MKKHLVLLFIMTLGFMSIAQTTTTPPKKHKKHVVVKKRVEKIVINNSDPKTVVEIKNGKIYVDGAIVSTIKSVKTEDHKIVINHKGGHKKRSNAEAWERKERPEHKEKPEQPERKEQPEKTEENGSATIVEMNGAGDVAQPNTQGKALLGVYTKKGVPVDGAYVARVMQNTPADRAGLVNGDIITKVNEAVINNGDDLIAAIGTYQPGDNVIVTYSRDGRTDITRVVLGDKETYREPQDQPAYNQWHGNQYNQNNNENWNNGRGNMYGYNNEFGRRRKPVRLGISASDGRRPRGVYLDEVKPGSPAEAAGLKPGDDITRIDGERVRNAYDMQDLLSLPDIGDIITIEYRHDGEKLKTEVHLNNNNNDNNKGQRNN